MAIQITESRPRRGVQLIGGHRRGNGQLHQTAEKKEKETRLFLLILALSVTFQQPFDEEEVEREYNQRNREKIDF